MSLLRLASMLVLFSLAGWFPVLVFFNTPKIVDKGNRLELLGGGRPREWQYPVEHDEGGNGAAGQARNPSLHALRPPK